MDKGVSEPPAIQITELPQGLLQCILRFLSFDTVAKLRMVSKYFDNVCSDLLNAEFIRLKADIQDRYTYLKSQMPRRESSRKNHPLANENEVIEALHLRIILLSISIGLHIQRNHCCFFAGEVLDEYNRLLIYLDENGATDVDEITNEIFDLSTMAVEYFKSKIEPTLPNLWCNPDSVGNSFDLSLKEESSIFSESINPGCDSSLQVLKKSLNNLKTITDGNCKSLHRLKAHIKSIEMDVDNLERLVSVMKQHQKECKAFVIPENDVSNVLYKIDQCEVILDSIESPPKPKRLKLKTNSSKNAYVKNSTCTASETAGNLFSLSDSQSMPSCSTSKVHMFDEELQQMNVSEHSKVAFSMLEARNTSPKRKKIGKL